MLGVYAISGREVSADTVAAILTILGYSVYDTIIVFDRVRENMRLMPRASIATIVNVSVSEVLKRSIVTSTITLLPIIALFILGGATLQDFAFAIMVGIVVGAVSTIFIATPLLSSLLERDPEYAGRRGEACDEKMRAKVIHEAEKAAAGLPAETPDDEPEGGRSTRRGSPPSDARRGAGVRGRQTRTAAPAAPVEAAWTTPVTTSSTSATRSTGSSRSSAPKLDELRVAVRRGDVALARRRDAARRGDRARGSTALFYELGLITREDWDELDLRVAQLEHRLRLIEERLDSSDERADGRAAATREYMEGNPSLQ